MEGGPIFRPFGPRRYYTGDVINLQIRGVAGEKDSQSKAKSPWTSIIVFWMCHHRDVPTKHSRWRCQSVAGSKVFRNDSDVVDNSVIDRFRRGDAVLTLFHIQDGTINAID